MQFRIIKREYGENGEITFYLLQRKRFFWWQNVTLNQYRVLVGKSKLPHSEASWRAVQSNRLGAVSDKLDYLIDFIKNDRLHAKETSLSTEKTTVIVTKNA